MKLRNFALSSIALACMATTGTVAAEDEWVDVYGKIMLTLDKVDEDNGDDQWEVNSNASRFGVKGKGAAGNLEAFYQLEWEVDIADESKEKNIKSRNQFVGVRGGFGEILGGRSDTPTKKLQKKIDLFGDLQGDIKHTFNAEVRASNIVQYSTPKMGGFKAKLALLPGEDTGSNDGLADATSIALEYKTGGLNLGLSMDSDVEGENVDTTRIMAQYKMDAWQFGLMYQDTDNNGTDGDGIMASVKYSSGDNAFKLQVIDSDAWEAGVSSKIKYTSQTSIGWDHKLGKKTTFFTYLTLSEEGANEDEDSIFGIGLVQKF
ncbi:porin [Aliikangiella sp. IMCC44359]|uniref:porin n=1 Tax=Aliikangiella sp. IMCC44359 TaxID=3459125 RepID=UPI00403AD28A